MDGVTNGYSDDDLQKIAKDELHEEPDQINDDIQSIRLWLYENNYTKRTDDTFILMFLRSCKFNEKKTRERIERYYELRLYFPNVHLWRDPNEPDLTQYFKLGAFVPLDYNAVTGAKGMIMRPGVVDPWNANFQDYHNVARMLFETFTLDKQGQIVGFEFILDLTDFRISHLGFFTPNMARLYCKFLKAYPIRLKAIHVLQLPTICYGLYAIFKHVLPTKLIKRIHIHGSDFTNFYEQMPPDNLPDEYGGTAGPISRFIKRAEDEVIKNKEYIKAFSY